MSEDDSRGGPPEACGAGSAAMQPAPGAPSPPDPDAPPILVGAHDPRLCGPPPRLLPATDGAEARIAALETGADD